MNKKSGTSKVWADKLVKTIRRKTRQTYSSEEKIRIVLAGLRGEETTLKECVADLTLENRLLKKSMTESGEFEE